MMAAPPTVKVTVTPGEVTRADAEGALLILAAYGKARQRQAIGALVGIRFDNETERDRRADDLDSVIETMKSRSLALADAIDDLEQMVHNLTRRSRANPTAVSRKEVLLPSPEDDAAAPKQRARKHAN